MAFDIELDQQFLAAAALADHRLGLEFRETDAEHGAANVVAAVFLGDRVTGSSKIPHLAVSAYAEPAGDRRQRTGVRLGVVGHLQVVPDLVSEDRAPLLWEKEVATKLQALGTGVAALGPWPSGVRAVELREWLIACEVDQVVAGRPLKPLAAAVPVPRRVHERTVPQHRDLHGVGIKAEIHFFRIADADATRASTLDEVAIDAHLLGNLNRIAGREGRPPALRLDGLLGQLQALDARAGHVERKPFLAAFFEVLELQPDGSRLEGDAALLGPHAVHAVVVHHQLAVYVQACAVVGAQVERIVALLGYLDVALEYDTKVLAHASQAGISGAALGRAGFERLELGEVRQFIPTALVGGVSEVVDFALGDEAVGILRAAAFAERAHVGDESLHLLVVHGGRRRHRRGGLLGHLVHRLADRLGEVSLVERYRGFRAAVAEGHGAFFTPKTADELRRLHGDAGRRGHVFVHLMAGETDFRLKERLAIGDQLRVIRSLGRR